MKFDIVFEAIALFGNNNNSNTSCKNIRLSDNTILIAVETLQPRVNPIHSMMGETLSDFKRFILLKLILRLMLMMVSTFAKVALWTVLQKWC